MNENVSILNYNIVLRKTDLSSSQVKLDKVKDIIAKNTNEINIIVSQFPDILVFAIPNKQLSVFIQNDLVAIANNSASFQEDDAELLAKLAWDLDKGLQEPLASYGLNFNYTFEFSNIQIVKKVESCLNGATLNELGIIEDPKNMTFGAIGIGEKSDGVKKLSQLSPMLDRSGDYTKQMSVQRNTEYLETTLPDITSLKQKLNDANDVNIALREKIEQAGEE